MTSGQISQYCSQNMVQCYNMVILYGTSLTLFIIIHLQYCQLAEDFFFLGNPYRSPRSVKPYQNAPFPKKQMPQRRSPYRLVYDNYVFDRGTTRRNSWWGTTFEKAIYVGAFLFSPVSCLASCVVCPDAFVSSLCPPLGEGASMI